MTTTITSQASVAGPATDDQIGHLKGLLDPRLRRLRNPHAQALIRAGGQFQSSFNAMLDNLLGKLVVQKAIDEVGFAYKYVNLPLEQFPVTEEPVDSVKELHTNEYLTTREVLARVKGASKKFASPLTALKYAARYPGKQLECPLAVIFEIDGQLWYLVLYRDGDERYLDVRRYGLDDGWHEYYRFLVVD